MLELPTDGLKFTPFEEKELRSLRLFHDQVERIWESRIIRTNSLRSNIRSNFTDSEITTEFPEEDDLRSLVTLVRACLVQSNPTFHETILGILKRRSVEETHSYLNKASELFFRSLNSPGLMVHINGREYSDKQIFDLWLNGHYFHFDDRKTEALECFGEVDYMAKSSLVSMLITYCKWFVFIDAVIKDCVEPFRSNP